VSDLSLDNPFVARGVLVVYSSAPSGIDVCERHAEVERRREEDEGAERTNFVVPYLLNEHVRLSVCLTGEPTLRATAKFCGLELGSEANYVNAETVGLWFGDSCTIVRKYRETTCIHIVIS
jgi:hypothetical protein